MFCVIDFWIKKDNNDICVWVLTYNKVFFFLVLYFYLVFIEIIKYQLNIMMCAFIILIFNLIPYFSNFLQFVKKKWISKIKIEQYLTKWRLAKTFCSILHILDKKNIKVFGEDFTSLLLFFFYLFFFNFFFFGFVLFLFTNIAIFIGL